MLKTIGFIKKVQFIIFPLPIFLILQKYLLDPWNNIYIFPELPELSIHKNI